MSYFRKLKACVAKASGLTYVYYEDGGVEVFDPTGRRIRPRVLPNPQKKP